MQHNDDALRELERVLASTEDERRIVLGDWNARIGELSSFVFTGAEEERGDDVVLEEKEYARKSTDIKANKAGKQIMDIMNAQGLVVLNGLEGEMQSTQRGSIGWSVVDYVAVSPGVLRADVNTRAVEGSDVKIFSDHVMVTASNVLRRCDLAADDFDADFDADCVAAAKDKTKQRWQKKNGAAGRVQWEQVREMGEVEMEDFVEEWCEQVKEMQHVDIESTWTRYKMRAVKVQEAKIGRKRVRPRKCQGEWHDVFDLELQSMKKETRRLLQMVRKQRRAGANVSELYAQYAEIRRAAKRRLKVVLKAQAVAMVKEVERLKETDAKMGWKALKRLMGMQAGKSATLTKALNSKGEECTGQAAREAVRDAYAALGIEDVHDSNFDVEFARTTRLQVRRLKAERICQEELDAQISLVEVKQVLKIIKAGKAAGCDEIMVEWLKFGGDRMTYALWVLCNSVWLSEKCPEEWSKGVITLLYKDGDVRDPLNYRGITLLSVVGKVFMRVLNARLAAYCESEDLLVDEQAGFRVGRSCADQLLILTEVLAEHRQVGKKVVACFIDVRKAYDRVWRDGLWKAL